jgi:phytoene desaturase
MGIDKHIIVIGAGFAGLASACVMAKAGYKVTVLEKNDQPGGRARVWEKDGFKFDMGPSWYWMPDVFENFFALFG